MVKVKHSFKPSEDEVTAGAVQREPLTGSLWAQLTLTLLGKPYRLKKKKRTML